MTYVRQTFNFLKYFPVKIEVPVCLDYIWDKTVLNLNYSSFTRCIISSLLKIAIEGELIKKVLVRWTLFSTVINLCTRFLKFLINGQQNKMLSNNRPSYYDICICQEFRASCAKMYNHRKVQATYTFLRVCFSEVSRF